MDFAFFLELIQTFGYLGVFLASLISSASIFIPIPSFVFSIAAGSVLNPFWVGIAGGTGSAIGEMTAYLVGLGIRKSHRKITKRKQTNASKIRSSDRDHKMMKTIKSWFHRRYGPILIFIFAATPLPDDILGIFCGIIKYDVKKFFIPLLLGKIAISMVLAYGGFYGISMLGSML